MTHTPETIATKAAEVRQLLLRAVAALEELEVMESVTLFALSRPEIQWEPVALAAAALAEKWRRDDAKAKAAPVVAVTVSLPQDPKTAVSTAGGGGLLPLPPLPQSFGGR